METKNILVTGATGYIGGRLIPALLGRGYQVRAMARSSIKLRGRPWSSHPDVEITTADLMDQESLHQAVAGCQVIYYLVHSMNPDHKDFAIADRTAAKNLLSVAEKHKVNRIIYLGGLGWDQPNASHHLKSRHEVGEILQSGSIPVTRFRAAQIIGSGSACYEIIRYLFERFPFFIIPRSFIETRLQPISIRNVLTYLVECLNKPETMNQSFEIGGPDILTYRQLFQICAKEKSIRAPIFINVPNFHIGRKLGFSLVKLALPLPDSISQPLFEGMAVQVILKDTRIRDIIHQELIPCEETIRKAHQADTYHLATSRWSDAGELHEPEWLHEGDADYSGGTVFQCGYKATLEGTPSQIWPIIQSIGGQHGYYFGDLIWRIRGFIDRLAGGSGLWRGRRHPDELWAGEALDFWRVLVIEPPYQLILLSEKRQPGDSVLIFKVTPGDDTTDICVTNRFQPNNWLGFLYWASFLPLRKFMLRGLIRAISKNSSCRFTDNPIYTDSD